MYGALDTRTVATSAHGHRGARQWDTHNLYGLAEAQATAAAAANITGRRPFVLSRFAAGSERPRVLLLCVCIFEYFWAVAPQCIEKIGIVLSVFGASDPTIQRDCAPWAPPRLPAGLVAALVLCTC